MITCVMTVYTTVTTSPVCELCFGSPCKGVSPPYQAAAAANWLVHLYRLDAAEPVCDRHDRSVYMESAGSLWGDCWHAHCVFFPWAAHFAGGAKHQQAAKGGSCTHHARSGGAAGAADRGQAVFGEKLMKHNC